MWYCKDVEYKIIKKPHLGRVSLICVCLSQKEFAEKLETTQQRVSEWECNKVEPSLYNILKILKILDVAFEELTEDIEESKNA